MSFDPTLVTEAHFNYVRERTTPEDDFLCELREAAYREGIPPISICPEQGAFMQILLRLRGARDVVEVGTLAGYSAIWMARALPPGGKLRTIELDPRHADFAARWIARSDVADRVEVHLGRGTDLLRTFGDASADAAFLDADKASYGEYLRESLRILRPRGLVMVDNAFAFGQLFAERPTDRDAPAVKAFNEVMAREPRLQSVIAPFGDGLWVAAKRD
jgi:predicted O-methyltransferase YrrM